MIAHSLKTKSLTMPKPFNWKSYLRSAARKIWLWSPKRREAIKLARVAKGIVTCAKCQVRMRENVKPVLFQVDHTIPASETASEIKSWDSWLNRLFECSVTDLRVLCRGCHDEKTKSENQERRNRKSLGRIRKKKALVSQRGQNKRS